jgi:hypothetical protein
MEIRALLNGILRLNTNDSKWEDSMGHLSFFNSSIELIITVLAIDITYFVVPPHNRFPV